VEPRIGQRARLAGSPPPGMRRRAVRPLRRRLLELSDLRGAFYVSIPPPDPGPHDVDDSVVGMTTLDGPHGQTASSATHRPRFR
jgi:hypothetical protein